MNVRHVALSTSIGVVIGLAVGGWLRREPEASPALPAEPVAAIDASDPTPAATTEAALEAIRNELAFERDARFAMAEELDRIWEELETLASQPAAAAPPALEPASGEPASARNEPASGPKKKWFDTQTLLGAGVPETDAERMRAEFEAAQLDELYLSDRATREGWLTTARYRQELAEIRRQLRAELGDEAYDWVQYASGGNNRVLIDDVLQDSPAARAGLRAGDVVVRYAGELVLSPNELRAATVRGTANETTAIDVMRGDEALRLFVPRGPLGARIGRTRRLPEHP